jgi:hypothetical protein
MSTIITIDCIKFILPDLFPENDLAIVQFRTYALDTEVKQWSKLHFATTKGH